MPFKRGRYYYVDLQPSGYPRRIVRSTETPMVNLAKSMESMLRDLAISGRHEALDALLDKRVQLPDLYAAYIQDDLASLLANANDPTLREVVDAYKALSDDRRYQLAAERLLDYAPQGARLSWVLDPDNFKAFLRTYKEEGLSPGTEHREVIGIGVMIREFASEKARKDLFAEVTVRKPKKGRQIRYLTGDDLQAIKKACYDVCPELWAAVQVSVATGIRRSELLRLRVKDINTAQCYLLVEEGKSASARRKVPFTLEVANMLHKHYLYAAPHPDSPLFPWLTDNVLRLRWEAVREEAGVNKRWHDLRHTYGVACAKAGMPIRELQKRMGHANITTTERYMEYAPPTRSQPYEEAMKSLAI